MRCCNFLTPRRAMRPTPSHSFPHTTAAETCRAACLRSRARARFLKARGVIRSAFWAWAVSCLHKEPGRSTVFGCGHVVGTPITELGIFFSFAAGLRLWGADTRRKQALPYVCGCCLDMVPVASTAQWRLQESGRMPVKT